ncbi:YueI family protein [Neobacillus sp. YIM B06451]|uniref:YueI family protein n=1 Tax=Neobacillus sp. YIM B06451 TaxID=3070994 RepID=UPI002930F1A2|nr:YueI family protein [Neobacillus sp. YIM B06451]
MKKPTVDDVLKQGIHGPKEVKPEERRRFLGTIRERILAALTKSQVYEPGTYPEVGQLMKEFPDAHLFVNGTIAYEEFSKYLKKANENKIEYTIVANQVHDTDIGLVLACSYAVDKEEIFIKKSSDEPEKAPVATKKGFFAKLGSFLGK